MWGGRGTRDGHTRWLQEIVTRDGYEIHKTFRRYLDLKNVVPDWEFYFPHHDQIYLFSPDLAIKSLIPEQCSWFGLVQFKLGDLEIKI